MPCARVRACSREEVAKRMAALTPGFAGADIANICNEAGPLAAADAGARRRLVARK